MLIHRIIKKVLPDTNLKKVSHLSMAKSTGISGDIFLGTKKFELRGIVKDSDLDEFLCFKQTIYKEQDPKRYKKVNNKVSICAPSTSASVMIMILLYLSFEIFDEDN